jgi:FkbM family methyltransferase
MVNKVIVYDIGAANFLPEHFPLDKRFEYVHCEPDIRGLDKLKTWLDIKQTKAKHTFFSKALGDRSQNATLALAEKNTSSSFSFEDSRFDGKSVKVQMLPLRSLVADSNLQDPNVIKIDVEGFELNVLKGVDLKNKKLKAIEVEVTLNSNTLSGVISLLAANNFQLAKVRTHGNQAYNPRNWLRGKIHGLARKLKFANFGVIRSEESWSKPTTPLTQIEFIFIRDIDLYSTDFIDTTICDIFGLAHRKSRSGPLKCGKRIVNIFSNLTLIR